MRNRERHKRITELFTRAVELDPKERDAFLEAECGEDRSLIEEVKSVLAHDGDDSLLGGGERSAAVDLEFGDFVGPYRVLEKLGEGGMGSVYLAEQQEPVRRKVALKIIKLGMDTKEVVARFEAERQALAMMSHPNIAKVFDAGATDRGRPYFVMEHVPGVPITSYCDTERLDTRERLALYVPVCEAIHHAHQKAIIHRDIKPSNVLVMVQDGKPFPKVIDFGLAKATDRSLTEKTIFTEQGRLLGTPVYMSPEQAGLTGLGVDTTTDIYSLGAMLYELLAGVPPFDPIALRRAGLEAIYRIIREEEPLSPSVRISGLGDEAVRIAVTRRTEPGVLERQVRGELDWITMRAMEKDPTRRYASASELASDLERHLQGEPVAAGPPTTGYKVRKFVQRNKAAVAGAVVSVFVLIAFAVTMTVMADRIRRERDQARLEAERGRLEAQALQSLILDASPLEQLPQMQEAIELHRRLSVGDDTELALYLVNQLWVLGYLYLESGEAELLEIRKKLEPEVFAVIDGAVAEKNPSLTRTMDLLKSVYDEHGLLGTMNEGGKSREQMEKILRYELALRRAIRDPDAPDLIRSLMDLSEHLRVRAGRDLRAGRLSGAEARSRESMSLLIEARDTGGAGIEAQMREARGLLGEALSRTGRYAEAEPLLLESLESNRREDLLRIIDLYESWGRPEEAERYREKRMIETVRPVSTIADQGGGHSALFDDRSIWLMKDLGPAGPWTNTWAFTDDLEAGNGLGLRHAGGLVMGRKLIPFTEEEAAFNAAQEASGSRERWAVVPKAMVFDRERGRMLVAYTTGLAEQKSWRYESRGTSLAIWEHPDSTAVRPIVRPGTEDPTLLFQGEEHPGCGELLMADGFLYLYWSESVGLAAHTKVARAPVAEAMDRRAWRFYGGVVDEEGDPEWVADWGSAAHVMKAGHELSVHWNEHLGKYLAIHIPPYGGEIRIRTADRPEGPWSPHWTIHHGSSLRGAHAHPEFARDGGRTEYISYRRPQGFLREETRLLEVTFR